MLNIKPIEVGTRVGVFKSLPVDGVLTRADYLFNRRTGAIGVVIGSPAGYGGSMWKVEHEGSGEIAAYFHTELAHAANLEQAIAEESAKAKRIDQGLEHPDVIEPDALSLEPTVAIATKVEADVMVSTVSSWSSDETLLNAALKDCAGTHFHDQVSASGLTHLMVCQALGDPKMNLPFKDVIFVVVDREASVKEIAMQALHFADDQMAATVSLPLSVFKDKQSYTATEVNDLLIELQDAVDLFVQSNPQHVRCIKVIIPPVGKAASV